MRIIQIAIDGPAGAGKSTIAKILADKLGYIYIDTGAMYRAITLAAIKKGISCEDAQALEGLAAAASIELVRTSDDNQRVLCDGVDVTEEVRDPLISQKVSQVAQHEGVRRELVKKQQQLAFSRHVVMDGRDIGTVVLPQAQVKIYLTASPLERAKRRYLELLEKGYAGSMEEIRADIEQRDLKDKSRVVGPLRPAAGAVFIDTTQTTQEQVVEKILSIVTRVRGEKKHDL